MPADQPLDPSLAPVRDLSIIAHLDRRWDPAWHRPHQLLRALAAQAPVLLVEEPVVLDDVRRERLDVTELAPGLVRALPRLPAYLRERERAVATVRALLQDAMRPDGALRGRFTGAVQWLTSAASSDELLDAFGEVGIVYDRRGVAARGLAGDLAADERALLARADLVLTAGIHAGTTDTTSDAAARRNVLDIAAAIDDVRWASPAAESAVPADLASLSRPIFGYLGPVDDRLDHAMLRALCTAAPQASVVLVGPPGCAPVDGAASPLPAGVHWLGARDESLLPAYARAFDACVFPLVAGGRAPDADAPALLECLVAGRPVVTSTMGGLPDALVSRVQLAASPRAFAAAAIAAAESSDAANDAQRAEVTELLHAEQASLSQVAARLRGALFEAIAARPTPLNAIADAIIAVRGLPPGATPGAR